jgi:hypothetical protein
VTVAADGFPLAAGLGAAQGDDRVCAADGAVHACLLEALADDPLNNQRKLHGSDIVAGQNGCNNTAGRLWRMPASAPRRSWATRSALDARFL